MFTAPALADPQTRLQGFEEVPVVSTTGIGRCATRIREDARGPRIEVELSYEDLEGNVQQAHIHLAQPDVNGGIVLFLCSNLPSPPAGTPPCPGPHNGTVFRTLRFADVLPVTTQGIAAGELEEVIDVMRAGKAYCNVHSDMSPGGEIRGQLR
jgi:hypothetical protein